MDRHTPVVSSSSFRCWSRSSLHGAVSQGVSQGLTKATPLSSIKLQDQCDQCDLVCKFSSCWLAVRQRSSGQRGHHVCYSARVPDTSRWPCSLMSTLHQDRDLVCVVLSKVQDTQRSIPHFNVY